MREIPKIMSAAVIIRGETFTGYRHADIRNRIRDTGEFDREEIANSIHDDEATGFILEDGTFMTREQALVYGRKIGQVGEVIGGQLTSEDLWTVEGKSLPPIPLKVEPQ